MSIDNQNPNIDGNEDEAVSLFNQLTDEDSKQDSEQDDEQLDQEQDTGTDEGDGEEQDNQGEQEADPWASVPEPQRQQFFQLQQSHQKLEADHRANAGRVSALTRKTAEQQEALGQLQKALADRERQNGGKADSSEMPTADDLKGKSFEQVKQEWPEVAEFLEYQIQQAKQELTQQLTPLQQYHQQQQQRELQQAEAAVIQTEYNRLEQAHPDFRQVVQDPAFKTWLNSQPPQVQHIAKSNNADDARFVLDQYKSATGKGQRQQPAPRNNLADHVTTPRKGAGRALSTAIPDDADPVDLYNRLNPS